MKFPQNKPLRNLGIYTLRDKTLILVKRSEELSFLFTEDSWNYHGAVDYRVSHGRIYNRGDLTMLTDDDLADTGLTANRPNLSSLINDRKIS